jgi:hypothetical protein
MPYANHVGPPKARSSDWKIWDRPPAQFVARIIPSSDTTAIISHKYIVSYIISFQEDGDCVCHGVLNLKGVAGIRAEAARPTPVLTGLNQKGRTFQKLSENKR